MTKVFGAWVLLGALAAGCVGCADNNPVVGSEPTTSAIFVGEVTLATETSIAVVVGAAEAVVYTCDGVGKSAWFFGSVKGGDVEATADDGASVKAKVGAGRIAGQVQPAGQAPVDFSVPLATGVAGVYLVEQSATTAKGFSATGGQIEAAITANATAPTVSGTVTGADGVKVTLTGVLKSFGEASGVATWIVQTDGDVKGRATKVEVGTMGGGNCSIWAKIKSLVFGVDCSYF